MQILRKIIVFTVSVNKASFSSNPYSVNCLDEPLIIGDGYFSGAIKEGH